MSAAEQIADNAYANEAPARKAGIPEIEIDGNAYKAEFTWKSFAEVRTKHGEDPDLMNPAVLGDYVACVLRKHHPMVTLDQIMTASPPMVPVARTIRQAISRLFWGDTPPTAI